MNVLSARIVLRERTLLDVADLALRFAARHALAFSRLGAIVLVPPFLVTWAVGAHLGWGWGWTLALALAPLASTPFTALASRLLFEENAKVREALGAAARALAPLALLRTLEGLGVALGAILLVPGAGVAALFLFTNEVIVLERAPIGRALSRMQRLAKGQSGELLLAVLFLTALQIVAVFLGDAVGRAVLEDLLEIAAPPSILETKGSALGLAAFWAFVAFAATCRFFLYINVRTRAEGWDVQTRFAALAAREELGRVAEAEA